MAHADSSTDDVDPGDDRRTDDLSEGAEGDRSDSESEPATDGRSKDVNGLIGGLLSLFLLSIVPFAPLFGGVVAGYLEGRDVGEGAVAGAYAGALAAVVTLFGLSVPNAVVAGFFSGSGFRATGGFVELVIFVGLFYLVGLAAAGGAAGAFLNDEIGDDFGRY